MARVTVPEHDVEASHPARNAHPLKEFNMKDITAVLRPLGRPRGSIGRRAEDAKEIVKKVGLDPLEFLLRVSKNRRLPWDSRIRAASAAAVFCHPKLSTQKVYSEVNHNVSHSQIHFILANPALSAQAEALALALAAAPLTGPVTDQIDVTPEPDLLEAPGDGTDTLLFFPEGCTSANRYPANAVDTEDAIDSEDSEEHDI